MTPFQKITAANHTHTLNFGVTRQLKDGNNESFY